MLKNSALVLAMLLLAFGGYVMIVNRNATDMTVRQKVLKTVYPVFMWMNKWSSKQHAIITHPSMNTPVSFYSLGAVLNDGRPISMDIFKGKKVLLVNTASSCGFTAQYKQLQQLADQHTQDLVVLGFPANDFKDQETGSDEEIAQFCQKNYGVRFQLMQKSVVVKKSGQHAVFEWLTDPAKNGWNAQAPVWNFSKYLVDEHGALTHYFGPGVSPLDKEVADAIANGH